MSRPSAEQVTLFAAPDAGRAGELLEAATVFALELRRHMQASIAAARLEGVLGSARGFQALVDLAGARLASEAFAAACARDAEQ